MGFLLGTKISEKDKSRSKAEHGSEREESWGRMLWMTNNIKICLNPLCHMNNRKMLYKFFTNQITFFLTFSLRPNDVDTRIHRKRSKLLIYSIYWKDMERNAYALPGKPRRPICVFVDLLGSNRTINICQIENCVRWWLPHFEKKGDRDKVLFELNVDVEHAPICIK